MYNICNCLSLSHCQLHMLYNKQQFGNFVLSMCTCRNCQMHTLCNRTIVHSRQEYMQVQHATCNWKCAHMHESSSWDCAFCSKSVVIYKVVNVSSLLSPSLSRCRSRSLLPSVTFETNQHLQSIAAIGQIFCIISKGSLILFQTWEKRDDPRRRTLSIEPRLRGHPFIVGVTLYWVIPFQLPRLWALVLGHTSLLCPIVVWPCLLITQSANAPRY